MISQRKWDLEGIEFNIFFFHLDLNVLLFKVILNATIVKNVILHFSSIKILSIPSSNQTHKFKILPSLSILTIKIPRTLN
jgi:hypothetical protein